MACGRLVRIDHDYHGWWKYADGESVAHLKARSPVSGLLQPLGRVYRPSPRRGLGAGLCCVLVLRPVRQTHEYHGWWECADGV